MYYVHKRIKDNKGNRYIDGSTNERKKVRTSSENLNTKMWRKNLHQKKSVVSS